MLRNIYAGDEAFTLEGIERNRFPSPNALWMQINIIVWSLERQHLIFFSFFADPCDILIKSSKTINSGNKYAPTLLPYNMTIKGHKLYTKSAVKKVKKITRQQHKRLKHIYNLRFLTTLLLILNILFYTFLICVCIKFCMYLLPLNWENKAGIIELHYFFV